MTRWLIALLGIGLVLVACGSGEAPQPAGTVTSERVEREATVVQQEQQVQEGSEQVAAAEPQAEVVEQEQATQVVELPVDVVGLHKGVRSERNVLGEPDAPVEILYYGDFT